ncbi:Nif3-like dinuclear metal center hexameric protein [Helicobacter sp. MIT 05-5294]|uniref:Nif3-like dinuclear metal center hexameric protein n=1 Tax=Helicobacter sp. MIT 05-5294 TaxID=1548150 RepID=UPI0010FE8275|nr:Nif3-like dinuclear metal center hexameric protein [Helicobacter sp. MIT 05-5294]TLD87031.1 Nif3-like dinuclear metal center hexameric protein [Helicobacter sp. MIT 05-5294]
MPNKNIKPLQDSATKSQKSKHRIAEILSFLDSLSPFELQESWDNSGLILGSPNQEFDKVYLSLEVTCEVLEQMDKDSLLITHHPLIFSPLKTLVFDHYPAKLLQLAIHKNIQLIAMHTNFDKTHFGKYIVQEILKISEFEQKDFVVYLKWHDTLESLCKLLKEKFALSWLKITKSSNPHCQNIALVTGSGGGFVRSLEAIDCLITGDIKYHEAMEAKARNLHLIDCGHYELESYFGEILLPFLTNQGYKAIILDSQNPFNFV